MKEYNEKQVLYTNLESEEEVLSKEVKALRNDLNGIKAMLKKSN